MRSPTQHEQARMFGFLARPYRERIVVDRKWQTATPGDRLAIALVWFLLPKCEHSILQSAYADELRARESGGAS